MEITPFQAGLGGALQAGGALLSRSSDKKERRRQEEYQTHMSNTAYQRAVVDMRKAGLNPMLAFQQGGASTPQGGSIAPAPNIGGAALEGVSKALQATNSATNLKTSIAANALKQSQIAQDQIVQDEKGYQIAIDKVTGPSQLATSAKSLMDVATKPISDAAKWSVDKMIPLKKAQWDLRKPKKGDRVRTHLNYSQKGKY